MKQGKICISPIDWGLGHATRCISLIKALDQLGYQIFIATEGYHEALLREAVPTAQFLHLRGYRIKYTKRGALLPLFLLWQLPKIIYSIVYEYKWLQKKQKQFHFDIIISDNRFGFFHKKKPSVFITHQLNLQMPVKWLTPLFQQLQYAWLKNFSACWIPDMAGNQNLSGLLANPVRKPSIPLWYMGCLSRLLAEGSPRNKEEGKSQNGAEGSPRNKEEGKSQNGAEGNLRKEAERKLTTETNSLSPTVFLGIVSGPEPQRSLLENLLWESGNRLDIKFVIIAGTPNKTSAFKQNKNAVLYPHLAAPELEQEIKRAEFIICRGGYTTLMELIPFEKKLIFIPTPGQTEQMYLGNLWNEKKWALCYQQANFILSDALADAKSFEFIQPRFSLFSKEALKNEIKQLTL